MRNEDSKKSLESVALKTSVAIGLLFALSPFKLLPFSVALFLINALFCSLLSILIWKINILLINATKKYNRINTKPKLRYLLSYLINLPLFFFILFFFSLFIPHLPNNIQLLLSEVPEKIIKHYIAFVFFFNTVVLIISESILLKNKRIMVELENAQLKIKNTESYYGQLKQQVHPHFLFNSLNTLKTLIKKDPDIAENYLVMLSDFLRSSISSTKEDTVILKEEVKLCRNYIEMQKIRFGNALQYSVNIPDDVLETGFVPIFSIQALIENAIKHNSLTIENPLKINVSYNLGYITVLNNCRKKITTDTSTRIGLRNLAERYKILSEEDILITKTEKEFCVKIKVLANENINN